MYSLRQHEYIHEAFDYAKADANHAVQSHEVAEVVETTSLSSITRLNQRRYVTVTATLEEGYNVTLLTTAAQKAVQDIELPNGVSYVFSGENETINDAMRQMLLMLLLTRKNRLPSKFLQALVALIRIPFTCIINVTSLILYQLLQTKRISQNSSKKTIL